MAGAAGRAYCPGHLAADPKLLAPFNCRYLLACSASLGCAVSVGFRVQCFMRKRKKYQQICIFGQIALGGIPQVQVSNNRRMIRKQVVLFGVGESRDSYYSLCWSWFHAS
ncbi:uncharacterized protein CANTADRAFT_137502 [Suhomyces tanzawaensis NRRL Y-17324]|uniref:Uncharacterized protein n=1 Tax=Suhomyces tanzawaensis NRRL Y-17324 TaxID=984487 RepID=A0A1E4SRY9_9ASCO|nr:uncharacterized protein CANTADRAFT_137502 [Suhomyces tanzawaensis NRRL Y-17324]ODV82187.1 hypothetical protein CANTADRAFT_137502 [Suhomyces tanzawaensis NRRL Y-17324]